MELKMEIPASRRVVEAYGDGGFRVTGEHYRGSLLVTPEEVIAWPVEAMEHLTVETLGPLLERSESLDIVLVGCGERMSLLPKAVREALSGASLAPEPMDTGAACRTYNVLVQEERRVAALLIAV